MDFDMSEAVELRKRIIDEQKVKVSYNDFLIKACALSLRDYSIANAMWRDGSIIPRKDINIGLAVALDTGLIVPVIRNADTKGLTEITKEAKTLVEKARNKRLTPDDYEGGTFTISNLGMYQISAFAAIINPGESGILAVGQIADRVVVENGGIKIKKMMTACLSSDHRVIDGAIAASFLGNMKEFVESPEKLL
jgi:pyruvate dehydrogenase E2 component (dihydrolipoamide acetyltransferase)